MKIETVPSARFHCHYYLADIPMNVSGGEKDRHDNREITIPVAGKTQDQRAMALIHWSKKLERHNMNSVDVGSSVESKE